MVQAPSFTLNGKPTTRTVDDSRMPLRVLRYDLGLTGTKYGCGTRICGACTVIVGKFELGPGSKAALAQLRAEELDVSFDSVDMVTGDTSVCPWGRGHVRLPDDPAVRAGAARGRRRGQGRAPLARRRAGAAWAPRSPTRSSTRSARGCCSCR